MDLKDRELFEEMLNDYLPEEQKSGEIITGILTRKEMDYSYLDLNGKVEGRIIAREVEDLQIGDKVEVKVLRKEEDVVIVSKFLLDKAKEFSSLVENEIVSGIISKKIKGGYSVKVGKNEGFLPFSLSGFEKDKEYVGEKFKFLIKEKTKNNIKLSRIDIIKQEEENYLNSINVDDVVIGKIKEILDFGIVLDLGLTTGLVHISEVAWEQSKNLLDKYNINDEITVKVIEKDIDKKKLKLSIKQLSQNPWDTFMDMYSVGDTVDVKVKEVLDFGLVVEAQKNSGFIHISEISWANSPKALKEYKVGDEIEAKIIEIEEKKKNIKLSIKQLTQNPWDSVKEKYKTGDVLNKTVIETFEFGIVVEIEKGIDAFIHKNELAWTTSELKEYKEGDNVEFVIINIDENKKKINGSVKQLVVSPWKEAAEQYKKGNKFNVEIVSIQENFALVKLTERFNGVIPKKELTKEFLKDINDKFKVGDKVEAIVIDTDEKKKSIVLSVKKIEEIEEKRELEELMKKYGV